MEDRELDDYLRGTSRLSAAYRASRAEEPPAEVDEVLLERSRRELRLGPKVAWSPFIRSWSVPLALAAVLVVSVSVTLVMYQETGELLPAPAMTQAPPSAAAPAQIPAAPAPIPEPESIAARRQQRAAAADAARDAGAGAAPAAGSAAPAREMVPSALRAEEKAAPALRAKQEAARDTDLGTDPEAWLKRIEVLRREGRHADADVLLVEFRKRFPDYPEERLPR
ncbi:MAG TPA: hypothetical protein VFP70_15620 [Burkholderiales bacterium]|nr:hypothetical protein [Burkholderiales bacterium]